MSKLLPSEFRTFLTMVRPEKVDRIVTQEKHGNDTRTTVGYYSKPRPGEKGFLLVYAQRDTQYDPWQYFTR